MPTTLNHTIVLAKDPGASANFLVEIFDLPPPRRLGHFTVVQVGPTSIDFVETTKKIASRHFAFLVSEDEFDLILNRLRDQGRTIWADPFRKKPGEINQWDDGRGVYFEDLDGHFLEALTRSYGSSGCAAKHPHPLLNCEER